MSKVLNGTIDADIRDSVPDWAPFESAKAPEGAPGSGSNGRPGTPRRGLERYAAAMLARE
jgi:hypothetical protein